MLALHRREEVEALTYHEVVGILLEAEEQEHDSRRWDSALKTPNPVETYNEMLAEIERRLDVAEGPEIDEMAPDMRSFLRNTGQVH